MASERGSLPLGEVLALVGVFLLALGLRLWGLGREPLHPEEARLAWSALHWLREGGAQAAALPLYPWWTGLLFFLTQPNAFWARFLSALAGAGLVAMPWLFFPLAGWRFRLLLALALALDPALVMAARLAHGPFWAVVPLLLFLWAVHRGRAVLALVSLALALSAGWVGWWSLGLFTLAWLLGKWVTRGALRLPAASPEGWPRQAFLGRAWLWATLFWVGWLGLGRYGSGLSALGQGLADLPQAWQAGWPWSVAFWFFLAYQAPVLVLALMGLQGEGETSYTPWLYRAAGFGLLTAFLWLVLPFRHPFWSVWVNLALWPAAVAGLLRLKLSRDPRAWALTLLHLTLFGWVWATLPETFRNASLWRSDLAAMLRLGAVVLAVWVMLLGYLLARSTLPGQVVGNHARLAAALALLFLQAAGWARVYGPPEERLWLRDVTAQGMTTLLETWQQLSLWRTGRPEFLPGWSTLDTPMWRWSLRAMPVRWTPTPPKRPDLYPEVLVAPAGQDFPLLPVVDYRAATFTVQRRVQPFQAWWEGALWWLHQQAPRTQVVQVALWVRQDVFP